MYPASVFLPYPSSSRVCSNALSNNIHPGPQEPSVQILLVRDCNRHEAHPRTNRKITYKPANPPATVKRAITSEVEHSVRAVGTIGQSAGRLSRYHILLLLCRHSADLRSGTCDRSTGGEGRNDAAFGGRTELLSWRLNHFQDVRRRHFKVRGAAGSHASQS